MSIYKIYVERKREGGGRVYDAYVQVHGPFPSDSKVQCPFELIHVHAHVLRELYAALNYLPGATNNLRSRDNSASSFFSPFVQVSAREKTSPINFQEKRKKNRLDIFRLSLGGLLKWIYSLKEWSLFGRCSFNWIRGIHCNRVEFAFKLFLLRVQQDFWSNLEPMRSCACELLKRLEIEPGSSGPSRAPGGPWGMPTEKKSVDTCRNDRFFEIFHIDSFSCFRESLSWGFLEKLIFGS